MYTETPRTPGPFPFVQNLPRNGDLWAVLALCCVTILLEVPLLAGRTVTGQDAATQFIPWYSLLGERLRAGDIPGWSPHQLAGAPFAADPQSGWTSLLGMLWFMALPLAFAVPLFVFSNVLLSGLFTYALARVHQINSWGALTAGSIYELNLFVQDRHACCWAYTGVITWFPLLLLGVEMFIRSSTWTSRGVWWGVAGLALSQVLATWLGQGTYYVLLVLGVYVAYRTLLAPSMLRGKVTARVWALVWHGGAVLLAGALFGAAGLLPRVEYNQLSNLAAGYGGAEQDAFIGGWSVGNWASILTRSDWHYAGVVALLLAVLAPIAAGRRHQVLFFAAVALAALLLSGQGPTFLHLILYRLPGFDRLHPHYPERVMTVFYLPLALMAGVTISAIWNRGASRWLVAAGGLVGVAVLLSHLLAVRVSIASVTLIWLALACAALLLPRLPQRGLAVLLTVLMCGDLLTARGNLAENWPDHFTRVRLDEYYAPTEAARFLGQQEGHFRYFGYDVALRQDDELYRWQWSDRRTAALLVNNRATVQGLQDIQGYNPVHVARFDEYMHALNGRGQEYRGAYILPSGIGSPLLDPLNVRYAVLPDVSVQERADLRALSELLPMVWSSESVRVLENPNVLPRAWIVHEARRVERGEALTLLANGQVDPGRRALLEEPPPSMRQPSDGARASEATVMEYGLDRMRVRTATSTPGLLMLSEVYYPAWRAYVDGAPARIYVADHTLRAVPVPVGTHEVELRYESVTLVAGTVVSVLVVAVWGMLVLLAAVRLWRTRRYTR